MNKNCKILKAKNKESENRMLPEQSVENDLVKYSYFYFIDEI